MARRSRRNVVLFALVILVISWYNLLAPPILVQETSDHFHHKSQAYYHSLATTTKTLRHDHSLITTTNTIQYDRSFVTTTNIIVSSRSNKDTETIPLNQKNNDNLTINGSNHPFKLVTRRSNPDKRIPTLSPTSLDNTIPNNKNNLNIDRFNKENNLRRSNQDIEFPTSSLDKIILNNANLNNNLNMNRSKDNHLNIHRSNDENELVNSISASNKHKLRTPTPDPKLILRRFEARRERLKRKCGNRKRSANLSKIPGLLYSAANNLFSCVMAKVGSVTWLQHLYTMEGYNMNTQQHHLYTVEGYNMDTKTFSKSQEGLNNILAKKVLRRDRIAGDLKEGVSMVTVRHPLARLVSVYKDLFLDGQPAYQSEQPERYRTYLKSALKALKRPLDPPLHVSFADYLRFVLTRKLSNHHFKPQRELCDPCSLSYQYVIKLETFREDLASIVDKHNLSHVDLGVWRNRRLQTGDTSAGGGSGGGGDDSFLLVDPSLQYYLSLPRHLLLFVIDTYRRDMDLFDYQVPTVLTSRLAP